MRDELTSTFDYWHGGGGTVALSESSDNRTIGRPLGLPSTGLATGPGFRADRPSFSPL
jgi:hypothetical protein